MTAAGVTVRLDREYRYLIEDVWSAWTEPERLRRWFGEVGGNLATGDGDTADPRWSALEAALRPTWKELVG